MKIKSVNPYTEEVNWTYDELSFGDCENHIEKSRAALPGWSSLSVEERTTYIARISEVLRQNKRICAEIITKETGKPIRFSLEEIEGCSQLCDYYAKNAEAFLKGEGVETETETIHVSFEPLGVILGIISWDFPFGQIFRFAIPALIAGNVCLLKPASNVPRAALEAEKVFNEAGLPQNVFKALLIDAETARELIDENLVDGVSLTGSARAASELGEVAGRTIKPFFLELRGSNPFIVLEDADVDRAAELAVRSCFLNATPDCSAARRFIVIENIAADFTEAFKLYMKGLKIGDPMDEETDIGPVAKKEFLDSLEKILKDAKKKGVKLHVHGKVPKKGFFFRPALVPAAGNDVKVLNMEIFGPIASVIVAKDENDVVKIANSTDLVLRAEIWSEDRKRARGLAKRIRAGFVTINGRTEADPGPLFGKVNKSCLLSELSYSKLKQFVNTKTIVVHN